MEPDIARSTISAASFGYLATSPNAQGQYLQGLPDPLTALQAACFLGNGPAFAILNQGQPVDDGTLHTAAFLALPEIVKVLVKTHSADHVADEFGRLIPLAVACMAQPRPWCAIANKTDFRTRQIETIKYLAKHTKNLGWRNAREENVLHIALGQGVESTKILIEGLKIKGGTKNESRYSYTDRARQVYTPVEYVRQLMRVDEGRKRALV